MVRKEASSRSLLACTLILALLATPLTVFAAPNGRPWDGNPLWLLWQYASRWISAWSDGVGIYMDPYGDARPTAVGDGIGIYTDPFGNAGPTVQGGSAVPTPPASSTRTPVP